MSFFPQQKVIWAESGGWHIINSNLTGCCMVFVIKQNCLYGNTRLHFLSETANIFPMLSKWLLIGSHCCKRTLFGKRPPAKCFLVDKPCGVKTAFCQISQAEQKSLKVCFSSQLNKVSLLLVSFVNAVGSRSDYN